MADIELVVRIPEEIYQHYKKVWQKRRGSIPESCIAYATPLPKGHGRLIDADALYEEYAYADCNFDMAMAYAPTIIEADKAESEEDEHMTADEFAELITESEEIR